MILLVRQERYLQLLFLSPQINAQTLKYLHKSS